MDSHMLKYIQYIMIFSATLPGDLINTHRQLYIYYQYLIQASLITFLFFMYGGIFIWDGSIEMLIKVITDMSIYTIVYLKGVTCMSSNMVKLITGIPAFEADLRNNNSKRILNVYGKINKKSKLIQLCYIMITYITFIAFTIPHFIDFAGTGHVSPNTTAVRTTPYHWWLPFDGDKYYAASFLLQVYCALLATNYYCFIEIILVVLPLHIILRLKVLKTSLIELETVQTEIENRESIIKRLLNDQIREHLEIINNCLLLNSAVKYIMLLEFLVASIQLSLALFQIISATQSGNLIFSATFIFQTLLQLLIQYWYANKVREESVEIGKAAYEFRWYEYSKSIKTNIHIMIMQSQKPLTLTIGPFGNMTLEMFVKIIKAVYTYMTFMESAYED